MVDFPQPVCPTNATVSFLLIVKLILSNIVCLGSLGYQNVTFRNSISPSISGHMGGQAAITSISSGSFIVSMMR